MSARDDFPDLVIPLEAAKALNAYFEFCEERHRARIAAQKQAAEEALAEQANEGAQRGELAAPASELSLVPPGSLYSNLPADVTGGEQ